MQGALASACWTVLLLAGAARRIGLSRRIIYQHLLRAMAEFEEESGITVEYEGSRDFETVITTRVQGGNPPDIALANYTMETARFVQRVWRLATTDTIAEGADDSLHRKLHRVIAAVTEALDGLQFNKAVAQLYELVSAIEKAKPSATRSAAIRTLVRLAAPAAPHLAEEAWAVLGQDGMVVDAAWPEFDPEMLVEDQVTLAIQVNGKLRDTLNAPRGLDRTAVEALALGSEKVQRMLDGNPPRKVIVVPDRLVNIVA